MKITKIQIKNYRGFSTEIVIDLGLDGKNLLIFGENGSGKSTLFHALNNFFGFPLSQTYSKNKNIFFNLDESYIKLSIGGVEDTVNVYELSDLSTPREEDLIIEGSKTKGFIDYKSLLATNYDQRFEDEVNLFNLFFRYILRETLNPISKNLFSEEWSSINNPDKNHSSNEMQLKRIDEFNDGVFYPLSLILKEKQTRFY